MADCLSGDLLAARLETGAKANILFVGDSLHNPSNIYPQKGWIVDSRLGGKWRAFFGMTQNGTSSTNHGYACIETGVPTTQVGCAPGAAHPTETTSCQGWHLRSLRANRFTTNPADDQSLPYHGFRASAWHTDWLTNNANLVGMELGIAHTNGCSSLVLRRNNRSNSAANSATPIPANGANALYLKETAVFNGGNTAVLDVSVWPRTAAAENENTKGHAAVLRGLRDNSKTDGIQIAYCGEGGWNVKSHSTESGYVYSSPAYTGYYLDDALKQDITLLKHDTYMFAVHTNQASDGWNGVNFGNFKSDYRAMLNRFRAAHDVARLADPTIQPFLGVIVRCWPCKAGASNWTAGDDTYYAALDTVLRELYRESPQDLVYMDLYARTVELEANIDTMRASYTVDGIHPNSAGGTFFGSAELDLAFQGGVVPSGNRGRNRKSVRSRAR